MRVQIHESRHHQLAICIDGHQRTGGRDLWFQRGYAAPADADISPGAQALARIDHFAAAHDQVEALVCEGQTGRPQGQGRCLLKKPTARKIAHLLVSSEIQPCPKPAAAGLALRAGDPRLHARSAAV
jgi:hypothetical protein